MPYRRTALSPLTDHITIIVSTLVFLVIPYVTCIMTETDKISDEQRLLAKLTRNYNPAVRPVFNASMPVVIRLGITLTQILDVDEKNQVLTLNVWLDQDWVDEKLKWDPMDYGNLSMIRIPCRLIWLPDIVLYNSVESHKGYMDSLAMVQHDGSVFWPPIVRMRSSCKMDITYFPFDDQVCMLKLGSWAYDGLQVDVTNRTLNIDLSNYVDNGEWILVDTRGVRQVNYYPCCIEPYPDVKFYLHIRRRTLYYTFNVIIPCILLSTLSLAGFYLPPDCGEKIGLGLTVLLALSVFMLLVADNIPATSEFAPLIGIYLTIVMAISAFSVVLSVFILGLHHRGIRFKRPPAWLRLTITKLARVFRVKVHTPEMYDVYNEQTIYTCPEESTNSLIAEVPQNYDMRCNGVKHSLMKEALRGMGVGMGDSGRDSHSREHRLDRTDHITEVDILGYFRYLLTKQEQTVGEKRIVTEWQDIALVVDRLFFCVFLILTISSSLSLLLLKPIFKSINIENTIQRLAQDAQDAQDAHEFV